MFARVVLASLLLAGVACGRAPPSGSGAETTAAPASKAGADQGGLCAEHGVLEAVCPKCNPALAAVFKAKGDWCDEHGFPESFCPVCNPEAGGRPALDVGASPADGAPAHGLKVRFKTRETARLAGLETVLALEAPSDEVVEGVARLSYDATKMALVSASVPGIVQAIRAEVGTTVARGAPLATIQSAEVGTSRGQVEGAAAGLRAAEAELQRRSALLESGMAARKDVEAAEAGVAAARAALSSVRAPLGLVGEGEAGSWTLRSPIAGEVTRREAALGLGVEVGTPLFEVVDPSTLWAEIDVAERDLGRVAVGSKVDLQVDALPDRVFQGQVATISAAVDPSTRTVRVRVSLDNTDRALRANMYATGRIAAANAGPAVVVPSAAVQRAGGVDLVFVRLSEDEYETRRVRVRALVGDEVRLADGVQPGEAVVTTGSFLLKTETLKDSIGAGCCDVE